MRSIMRNVPVFTVFLLLARLSPGSFAQSGIITTYVGPSQPAGGARATTQAIDEPSAVAADGSGGFYVASRTQDAVYRITADGRLRVVTRGGTSASGDETLLSSTELYASQGLAVDTEGNLFIADNRNNLIRKVTPTGLISVVAGNGTRGFSGDGGRATDARLFNPTGVVADAGGSLFIVDNGNNRIRKVTPAGIIGTVAGTGISGFDGDGGAATAARLNDPYGIALDGAGMIFIVDRGNNRIRKVTPAGMIRTVAGNGSWGFSGDGGPAVSARLAHPRGVVVDGSGNLLIADTSNDRIRKVTPEGLISTVAGNGAHGFSGDGGPATGARLNLPSGIALDEAGNLLIADRRNHRVRKVTPCGTISTAAGTSIDDSTGDGGPAAAARLNYPSGVALDGAGNLFISDTSSHRIRRVTPAGIISTIAGNGAGGFGGDGGPAAAARLYFPEGIAVDGAGNLFVADKTNHRIRKVTPAGIISTVAGTGTRGFSGDGGPAKSAQLCYPKGIAVDTAGNLFIVDGGNNRIRKVTPGGVISTVAGNGAWGFGGDGGPAIAAQLLSPEGIAADAAGNLFIADRGNNRIRKVEPGGVISTVAGNGEQYGLADDGRATSTQLDDPRGLALDAAGNLFVTDSGHDRIRKITPGGLITTVAGDGTAGFSGDGGPAKAGRVDHPGGLAVDQEGNLFIADTLNCRVRRVSMDKPVAQAVFARISKLRAVVNNRKGPRFP